MEGNEGFGVFAVDGGNITVADESVIQNNGEGVGATNGGTVMLRGGTSVSNNTGYGVVGGQGGSLTFQEAIIESNGDDGISLSGVAAASFEQGTIIWNNNGNGVVLNTSLNRRGEPMVCSPEDALNMFYGCDLEYLMMEDILIMK